MTHWIVVAAMLNIVAAGGIVSQPKPSPGREVGEVLQHTEVVGKITQHENRIFIDLRSGPAVELPNDVAHALLTTFEGKRMIGAIGPDKDSRGFTLYVTSFPDDVKVKGVLVIGNDGPVFVGGERDMPPIAVYPLSNMDWETFKAFQALFDPTAAANGAPRESATPKPVKVVLPWWFGVVIGAGLVFVGFLLGLFLGNGRR